MAKKVKKLEKKIEGAVVSIKEITTDTQMVFDFSKLPAEIQAKLGPFGLSHKLGDAASASHGQEAVDDIKQVWDGLMKGDWSVRAPRGESVSLNTLNSGLEKLPPKEAQAARALLLKLGILKAPAAAAEAVK